MSGLVVPGLHLLVDFWQAEHLQDKQRIEQAMRAAAAACGATVLSVMLHEFGEDAGITGVAILAESHISIHTWPELDYIALDIFMCGQCNPHLAIPILKEYFAPKNIRISEHGRGGHP